MSTDTVHDIAIIGGGIAGLIHLHYARQAGLSVVLLEVRDGVGGLWRELPAWQDIQICPADWTVGDLPVAGPLQPQILDNIQSWVSRFGLADDIRLGAPVSRARHTGACWALDTPAGPVRARHLVAATGGHNRPVIPAVQRRDSTVQELHSSALRDPAALAGHDVLVVGGGASAFDLLDLALQHQARRVLWVYRGVRWFTPTSKPKAVAGSVRPFAKMQASGMPIAQQNALLNADLRGRYAKFGIEALLPEQPLDLEHDQLIPGRARMLAQFGSIERHPGTVQALEGGEAVLADGRRLAVDTLLWGTGYETDLSYFEDPRLASIRSVRELAARCGCVFRSLDAPDLYFPGVGLEGIGATSWMYALGARAVMSHIRGTAPLDMQPTAHRLNHLDMARHLAERDPGLAGGDAAWAFYRGLALNTPDDQPYPLP